MLYGIMSRYARQGESSTRFERAFHPCKTLLRLWQGALGVLFPIADGGNKSINGPVLEPPSYLIGNVRKRRE